MHLGVAFQAGLPHEPFSAKRAQERTGTIMDTHVSLLVVALGENTSAIGMGAHEPMDCIIVIVRVAC